MGSVEKIPSLTAFLPWSKVEEVIQQRPAVVVAIGLILALALLVRPGSQAVCHPSQSHHCGRIFCVLTSAPSSKTPREKKSRS